MAPWWAVACEGFRYPAGVQLTVLGSNGTYATAGRPASGYLVYERETTLWMDAGPGTYLALCAEMDPSDLHGVFLSHRHPDHCTDIFALYHALAYGNRKVRGLPVFCPEDLADLLGALVGNPPAWRSTFDFIALADGDTVTLGAMEISVASTNHPPPTLAPRIEAAGRSLTYTADTGPSPALEGHARESNVLLAEATLPEARDPEAYAYHLTAVQAGEMGARAGVDRLVLTHLAPYLDPDRSVMEAESVFRGPVWLAVPGARIRI